jgi:hypothetical protein
MKTNDKSLKDKAINIKGTGYVQVKDRIIFFNEHFPNGMIENNILSNAEGKVVVQSKVIPDVTNPNRFFIGHSQADEKQGMVNKTAALENCETSAVGRALAMMGIGILESVASADEIKKAVYTSPSAPSAPSQLQQTIDLSKTPTSPDNEFNKSRCERCGAPIAISKAGHPYCSDKCWLKDNTSSVKSVKTIIQK